MDDTAINNTAMKEAFGIIVECAKASEFLRWETAMREVVTDIRAKAADYRTRSALESDGMVAVEFLTCADECDRIAGMLDNAVDREASE